MLDEIDLSLLQSLKDRPKLLDWIRCPVLAIERAFKLEKGGYINMAPDGWLTLTDKGHQAINGENSPRE